MQKEMIKTKRLTLRPLSDEEMAARMEAERDAHMKKALGEMLAGCKAHPLRRLWYAEWQIALRDGVPIGSFSFKGEPKERGVEIGYGIEEPYRRQGYCAEAMAAAIEWAFGRDASLYYIMAETEEGNLASRGLLQKLGFVPAGQGEEGPRFEKERPKVALLPVYLCLGMSLGMSLGLSFDQLAIGMSLGMCLGVALGAALDAAENKKREKIRAERGARKAE